MSATTRVSFVKEDGSCLPTWHVTGRPVVGDRMRRSYNKDGLWEVIAVEWTGDQQARCVCKPVPPDGEES
jgi:hypothetical protein